MPHPRTPAITSRLARTIALAALLLVALTGCLKADMGLRLHDDDTVSGEIKFGVSKDLVEMMGGDLDELMDSGDGDFPEGAKVEEWSDGDYVGQKISFERVPLAEMNDGDDILITREGDEFVFGSSLLIEEAGAASEGGSEELPLPDGMDLPTPDVEVRVTFPGEVIEANGSIDGNTVTWDAADLVGIEEMAARGSAIDNGKADGGGWLTLLIRIIGGVLILGSVVGLGLMAYRRFAGRGDSLDAEASTTGTDGIPTPNPWPTTPHEQQSAAHQVGATVGDSEAPAPAAAVSPGWYPTADGAYLRYHDGTDWTEHVRSQQ